MKWNPEQGFVPRGFTGAIGECSDVRLVLVCAEPVNPHEKEHCVGTADELMESTYKYTFECFKKGKDLFHRNVRYILDLDFSGKSFEEQMQFTWITDSVLCSAHVECGSVPSCAWQACEKSFY